jgi:hypothetical protein
MRRSVIALALAASTLTSMPSGFFHPLWSFLASLWGESSAQDSPGADGRRLTAPHMKAEPGWVPSGRTLTAPPPPSADAGPGMDPWGSH